MCACSTCEDNLWGVTSPVESAANPVMADKRLEMQSPFSIINSHEDHNENLISQHSGLNSMWYAFLEKGFE